MRKSLDKLALAIRLLGDLKGWAEGESFLRHRKRNPFYGAYTARQYDKFAAHIENVLKRLADDTLCHDNCKNLYFCTRKKNHKGKHRDEFGLTWES